MVSMATPSSNHLWWYLGQTRHKTEDAVSVAVTLGGRIGRSVWCFWNENGEAKVGVKPAAVTSQKLKSGGCFERKIMTADLC